MRREEWDPPVSPLTLTAGEEDRMAGRKEPLSSEVSRKVGEVRV